MHKKTLREIAKFASGLVMGDFLCGLWLWTGGFLPASFFGFTFHTQNVVFWMVFDVLFFAFLVHYGWRKHDEPRTERERKFHLIAGWVFLIVAILHLLRVLFGVELMLGLWDVPYWINGLAAIITAFLSYASFKLAKRE